MTSIVAKFIGAAGLQSEEQKVMQLNRRLVQREAELGGALFGPMQDGRTRQFFCLDEKTWVWHETWTDKVQGPQSLITRYQVSNKQILKSINDQPFQPISRDEALNFEKAIRLYSSEVIQKMYPSTKPTQQTQPA